MTIEWKKCIGKEWCELYRLNLSHDHFQRIEGVFVLWYTNDEGKRAILTLGSGAIVKELTTLKEDPAIRAFENYKLCVTWSIVPEKKMNAIMAYLYKTLDPMIKNETIKGFATKVNLPWE